MTEASPRLMTLGELPVGGRARIAQILGGRRLTRQLMSLGLRVGSEIDIVQHRGRGVVLATGSSRVALGRGVAEKLLVVQLPAARSVS